MPEPKLRLEEVAKRAGVSRATASKALNRRGDVSAATRERVLAAAKELGYRRTEPNEGSLPLIAWVADNLTTTYTLDILRGSASTAQEAGVGLVTQYTARQPGDVQPLSHEWFESISGREWLGAVVVTSRLSHAQLDRIRDLHQPVVAIDPDNAVPADLPSIGATNWNGGVEATQHLVDLGHRRIGFVRGTEGSVPAVERMQGYISALSMNDLLQDPRLIAGSDFTYEEGVRAGLELLSLDKQIRPSALFVSSDLMALGVYSAARQLGLSIPDDVSIVGFDDSLLAGLATPGLTTVRQPLHDMGAAAVRTLIDLRAGRRVTAGPIRLATNLVLRGSTAPPA